MCGLNFITNPLDCETDYDLLCSIFIVLLFWASKYSISIFPFKLTKGHFPIGKYSCTIIAAHTHTHTNQWIKLNLFRNSDLPIYLFTHFCSQQKIISINLNTKYLQYCCKLKCSTHYGVCWSIYLYFDYFWAHWVHHLHHLHQLLLRRESLFVLLESQTRE